MSKEASFIWLVNFFNTAVYIRQPCFFCVFFSHVAIPKWLLGFPPSLAAGFQGVFQKDMTLLTSRTNTARGKDQTDKDNNELRSVNLKKQHSIYGFHEAKALE